MHVKSQLIEAQLEQRATAPTKKSEVLLNTASSNQVQYYDGANARTVGNTDQSQTLTNKTLVVANNTITTAPNGNLAATELNTALAELQSDIDTRATSTSLSNHASATTSTHGVTGTIVGTSDTQTLSNKTFADPTTATKTVDLSISGATATKKTTLAFAQTDNRTVTFPDETCTLAKNPMTAEGDIVYGGTSGIPTRLAKGIDTKVLTLKSGLPSWETPETGFANPMTTGGDIIYGGSSGTPTRLANGSAGDLLQSAGTTAAPTWFTPTYVYSINSSNSAWPITYAQWGDLLSISLESGEWDINGWLDIYNHNALSGLCEVGMGISTTSGNYSTGLGYGSNSRSYVMSVTQYLKGAITIPKYNVTVASTTTYYLKGKITTNEGSNIYTLGFHISARRVK